MSRVGARLRSLVWSQGTGRVRAVWRVLVPVLTGFLALQLAGAVALTLGVNRGQMLLAAFAGTTLVMSGVISVSARYLDRRPLRAYGYSLSREWLFDLVVAMTFVVARYAGSLRVTSTTLVPDVATLGWLVVFFAAFLGVAFYEEFIYRGAFVTNAVEGLTARGVTPPVATAAALLVSTLAFAFVHLPGAVAADASVALVAVKTGLLGGLFGVAYIRTGELALPMGVHLGVNYALMNVFGIGSAETPGVPTVVTVEHTATGLWSPARGIPVVVAILAGYVLVFGWTRWRRHDSTTPRTNSVTRTHSDP